MKTKSSTDVLNSRDVRGKFDRLAAPRKAYEAWLSWELLQRGVINGSAKMSSSEIAELCGVSRQWVDYSAAYVLSCVREYNNSNAE